MKLSVIIPVYNTENYLRKCFDSLVNQTYKDIEYIVVNDGSKDNSIDIINEYASRYPNFKVIDQPNKGYSGARNPALEQASGDYIGFVDSDDFIETNMFEKLMRAAKDNNADIVSCAFYRVFYNDNVKYLLDSNELCVNLLKQNRTNDNKHKLKDYGELLLDHGFVWNRIYSTKMLKDNDIKFPTDIIFGEDTYFHRIALAAAENIVYIPEPLYYYRQGRTGAQTTLTDKRNMSFLKNCENLYKLTQKEDLAGLIPWFNHLTLSLCALGYERIDSEYKNEYYTKFAELISKLSVKSFRIAYPNYTNVGFFIKARYMVLKMLHPMMYFSLKINNKFLFDIVIKLRILFQYLPNIIRKILQRGR